MLHIQIVNRSDLAEVSDYEYRVMINHREICSGFIKGHVRKDGWIPLVRRILILEQFKEVTNVGHQEQD